MNRIARSGRTALLARTALGSAILIAAAAVSGAAAAQVSSGAGGTVNAGVISGQFTATGTGGATFSNPTGAQSDIVLGSNRTLLTWNSFNLASGNTLNFVFGGRGDIVVNRIDSGTASINGALNGSIGAVGGATGGNVWLVAPGGLTFGGSAVVNVGGLLATTGAITGADFFDGNQSFSFDDAPGGTDILVQAGAQLRVHGGTLALVAPSVQTTSTSTITDQTVGKDSDVLFGSADQFTISFAPDAAGDLDLLSWTVPAGEGTDAMQALSLAGTTNAGNVYVAAVSRRALGSIISADGVITASGAVASGDGNIVLVAGGGISNGAPTVTSGQTVQLSLNNQTTSGRLVVNGPTVLNGASYNTTASQTWNGPVTLGFAGNVFLNGGAGTITVNNTVNGASGFILNSAGAINLNGDIGGVAAFTAMGGGPTTLTNADITTSGNIVFANAVILGSDILLSGGSLVDFDQTITGPFGLEVRSSGTTNFEGAVNIASLTTDAGGTTDILASTITTSGAQSYGDAVRLFNNVTLTGGSGAFTTIAGQTVNRDLALNFGGVTTLGGNLSNIRNLSVAGGGTTNLSGAVNTSGTQTYTDAVTLTSDTALTSTGVGASGNITLNGITGAGLDLTVTSTAGSSNGARTTIAFNGVASGIDALVASAGIVDINAALSGASINFIAQHGAIDVGADITATGNALVQATAASGTIVGNGRVGGAQVLLTAGAGIGVSAGNRVGTAAGTLTASGGTGGVFISELNGVTLQNNGAGNGGASYDLTAGGAISVNGPITAPNGVTLLTTTGDIAFTGLGQISATSGDIRLTAADVLDRGPGSATLTAQNIFLTADDFANGILGAAALQETNNLSITDTLGGLTISALTGVSAANNLTITTTSGGGLSVGGVAAGGAISLVSAGDLALTDNINGGAGLVTLTAGGPGSAAAGTITQTGGVITAGLLGGSAGAGSAAVLTQVNAVTSLGNFTANGFSFTNSGALAVTGAVNGGASATIVAGGDITLSGPASIASTNGPISLTALGGTSDIVLNGAINAGAGTFTTNAGASINQAASGVITAGKLTGGAGTSAGFNGTANQVAGLGTFNTGTAGSGGFLLINGTSLSTVSGESVTTNGNALELRLLGANSDLTLNGTLNAGGSTVTLSALGANGDITQLNGSIVAATLTGQSGGATTLTRTGVGGNAVLNLGFFQAGGAFSFAQDGNLNVVDTVNGVNGAVNVTSVFGDIIVAAPNGFVTSGGTVTLDAGDALTVNGRVAGGTGVNLLADAAVSIGAGTFRVQTTSGTVQLASDFADITVNGGVDAGTGSIDIDSADGSVQIGATGSLSAANTIDVDAGGLITVGGAVNAAAVVDLQSSGALSITGIGQVGSAGSVRLASTGGSVAIGGGGVQSSAGVVDLDSASGVSQTAAIVAGTLTGTNGGQVTLLHAGNAIGSLGAFSASGFALRDTGNLGITGAVNIGTGLFELVSGGSIDQAVGSVITAGTFTGSANGVVDLFDGSNQIQTLGAFTNTGTTFSLRNGAALNVNGLLTNVGGSVSLTANGALAVNNTISATGRNVTVTATGGALTIGAAGAVIGSEVVLSTDQAFVNSSGSDAITASDRWLVYSATPGGNSYGGLNSGNTAIWNGNLTTRAPGTITGNRYVFAFQPTLTVTTLDLSKVYGSNASGSAGTLYNISGLQAGVAGAFLGDSAATAFSGAPTISSSGFTDRASVLGGPYTVTASTGSLASGAGYGFAFNNIGRITVSPLGISGTASVDNRAYDGTTNATGTVSLSGVLAGDTVGTAGGTFTFASKNAGSQTVNVSGVSLNGADAGNYTLTLPATAVAEILRRAINGTANVDNRVYDGTTNATGTVSLAGVVAGDTVGTTGGTFTFASKNAGSQTVNVSGVSLNGADAGNYTLTLPATAVAEILRRAINGTANVNNRDYDGTTNATGTVSLSGVLAGDTVGTTGGTFTFASKNAGSQTVNVSGVSLNGADAGNYTLTLPATAVAEILRLAISGTANVNNRAYDGTTNATGTVSLSGVLAGDTVGTTGGTFTFASKNAGSQTVNVSGVSLNGADAGNYTLTLPATAVAEILRRAISGTASVNNRAYDGTTNATGTVSLSGVLAGDTVGTTGGTFTFASKNAGSQTVNVSGVSLNGADAGNYTLTLPATAVAEILRRAISGTASVNNRDYDGTTNATGTVSLSGVLTGDTVGTTGGTFTFASKNAGSQTVNVSGVSLNGADAGNYTLTLPATAVAEILRRAITVTANPQLRGAGQPDPALTYALTNGSLVSGETLSGALARAAGEAPGAYAIQQGSLAASSNYLLTFVGNTLVIQPAPPTDAPQPQPQPNPPRQIIADFLSFATQQIEPAVEEPLLVIGDDATCGDGANGETCNEGGALRMPSI